MRNAYSQKWIAIGSRTPNQPMCKLPKNQVLRTMALLRSCANLRRQRFVRRMPQRNV